MVIFKISEVHLSGQQVLGNISWKCVRNTPLVVGCIVTLDRTNASNVASNVVFNRHTRRVPRETATTHTI